MKTNSYADPRTEKRYAYEAAAALLAKEDQDSLRYAALELRRCIEASFMKSSECTATSSLKIRSTSGSLRRPSTH